MPLFKPRRSYSLNKVGENIDNLGRYSKVNRALADYMINLNGVPCYIYRLEGTFDQSKDITGVEHDEHGTKQGEFDIASFMGVQDPLLMENRDRKYNIHDVPMIRGVYSLSESEIELMRFGFSTNEVITMEFSLSAINEHLGRNLIVGDVVELPHMRRIGMDGRVANRWYSVVSVTFSPSGYDLMYQPHIVAVSMKPIRHQQEFLDIIENVKDADTGETVADTSSNFDQVMAVTSAIQDKAASDVPTTMFDTSCLYFDPHDPTKKPDIYKDDGLPPNHLPVNTGVNFPPDAKEYDWFVRTDHNPNRLYQFVGGHWLLREIDYKREWQPYGFTAGMERFMSKYNKDGTDRGYELKSIHDTLTDRSDRSDPTRSKKP